MNGSLARLLSEPVMLARQRCEVCHGERTVPTPEFAGWNATVERLKDDHLAQYGGSEQIAYDKARGKAGPAPNATHADCKGCERRGYNEVEVSLDQLSELLNGDKKA